jgi:dimethylhistidine N-methyltransferase
MNSTSTIALPRDECKSFHQQFLRDVIQGLRRSQKEIPCKYFYDERGSSLFDEICELDEYYLTRTEISILRSHAREMAAAVGEDCALVEFGSGSGLKTRLLLEKLRSPRAYLPVELAREHLTRSSHELADEFADLHIVPIHADFTESFSLPELGDPRPRRVVYFPGSTIGNFSPSSAVHLLGSIARLVGPAGGLLIGFDLDKPESIVLPAYNDSLGKSAAFNLNVLARINRELGANFDLTAFSHRAIYNRERERMEMYLVSAAPQIVRVAGHEFAFDEGEVIHTEYSYKYKLDHFNRLTARAGFTVARQWTDPLSYFMVQYLIAD